MLRTLRILVLSAGYGEGHAQVSRVLQRCFQSRGIEDVKIVDLIGEAHPVINAITRYMYLKSYYVAPSVYGWLYYSSKQMGPDTLFSRVMMSFGLKKLEEIIETEKPHAVINTFPHPAMSAFLKKTGASIPTFTVITDYALHNRWIQPEIDKYYVASDDLKNEMVKAGIPPERIKVSGIPLRETFNCSPDVTGLHQKYGLDPAKKTILVMSGAYGGLQKINEICQSLLEIPDSEIAVVCGKDETTEKLLKNSFQGCRSIHVFGFVEDVHELMKIACCIITKAGGVTLSEAVAAQLPIVIFRPVPGQERDNALYFARKGAAVVVNEAGELYRQVSDLLSNGEKRSRMRASVKSLQRPRAAETVVDDILNVLDKLKRQGKPAKRDDFTGSLVATGSHLFAAPAAGGELPGLIANNLGNPRQNNSESIIKGGIKMNLQLTQKERSLLEDQKKHEEICIQKYTNYAQQAEDPQLKQLFNQYASQEQQHYNTINQLLQGQQPMIGGNQGYQQQAQQRQGQQLQSRTGAGMAGQGDAALCTDMLMTEKFVSSAYDTAIFESANAQVRQALQHIQKEEQQHGEGLFNYMQQNGMYNPQ